MSFQLHITKRNSNQQNEIKYNHNLLTYYSLVITSEYLH